VGLVTVFDCRHDMGDPVTVVRDGGFSRFRRAAQTPFNLIFEARA